MDGANGQEVRAKAWQPLKLLNRFRSRVTALTSWDASLAQNRSGDAADADSREMRDPSLARYACDVAYICDDATPAEMLIRARMAHARSPQERSILGEVYQRLHAIYSVSGSVPHRYHVERMVDDALRKGRASGLDLCAIADFLASPLNDALCREQALSWVAQSGARLHLYGHGWQHHPHLGQFRRDFTGSDDELMVIFRMARINLRLTPGTANEAVLSKGIRCGAFFLMRFFPEDVIERIYRPLHEFCRDQKITSDRRLRSQATPAIRRLIEFAEHTLGVSPFSVHQKFVPELLRLGEDGLCRFPGGLWEEYDAIAFASREEMLGMLRRYLNDAPERRRIAGAMRRRLVETENATEQTTGAQASPLADPMTAGEVAA